MCLSSHNWDVVLVLLESLPTSYLKLWSPSEYQLCGTLIGSLFLKCSAAEIPLSDELACLPQMKLTLVTPELSFTIWHSPMRIISCLVFLLLPPNQGYHLLLITRGFRYHNLDYLFFSPGFGLQEHHSTNGWVELCLLPHAITVIWTCGVGEDSWESLGLQGYPTSPS